MQAQILNFFFPKKCISCKKTGSYFCAWCTHLIVQNELVCPVCERTSLFGVTHAICRRRYNLDGLWNLGVYQNPLRLAIQKLKYRWVKEIADELTDIMIEYWAKYQPFLLDEIKQNRGEDWVVVPVPLHWQRQNWRGFNQSALLAKLLAQKLGLKYSDHLVRTRNTTPQMKLLSKDRKHNIKGAFALNTGSFLLNTNVILVDDVWTTGSTLKECCFVLKRSGFKKVWAVTIAR
jgi:competence protein ComFC